MTSQSISVTFCTPCISKMFILFGILLGKGYTQGLLVARYFFHHSFVVCRNFVVAVYFFVTSGHFSISHLLLVSLSVGRLTRENTRLKSPGPREKNLGPDSQKKKKYIYIYIYGPHTRLLLYYGSDKKKLAVEGYLLFHLTSWGSDLF